MTVCIYSIYHIIQYGCGILSTKMWGSGGDCVLAFFNYFRVNIWFEFHHYHLHEPNIKFAWPFLFYTLLWRLIFSKYKKGALTRTELRVLVYTSQNIWFNCCLSMETIENTLCYDINIYTSSLSG